MAEYYHNHPLTSPIIPVVNASSATSMSLVAHAMSEFDKHHETLLQMIWKKAGLWNYTTIPVQCNEMLKKTQTLLNGGRYALLAGCIPRPSLLIQVL